MDHLAISSRLLLMLFAVVFFELDRYYLDASPTTTGPTGEPVFTPGSNSIDDKIVSALQSGQATVFLMGVVKSIMYVIIKYSADGTYYYFKLPPIAFDGVRFHLQGAAKLDDVWPELQFNIPDGGYVGFVHDKSRGYITFMQPDPSLSQERYTFFNMSTAKYNNKRMLTLNSLKQMAIISTDQAPLQFFSAVHFSDDPAKNFLSIQQMTFTPTNGATIDNVTGVAPAGDHYTLCANKAGIKSIRGATVCTDHRYTSLFGNIVTGFVYNKKMVVVYKGPGEQLQTLLVFDAGIVQDGSGISGSKLVSTQMRDAWVVGKTWHGSWPAPETTTEESNRLYYIIGGAVIGIVAVLVCVIIGITVCCVKCCDGGSGGGGDHKESGRRASSGSKQKKRSGSKRRASKRKASKATPKKSELRHKTSKKKSSTKLSKLSKKVSKAATSAVRSKKCSHADALGTTIFHKQGGSKVAVHSRTSRSGIGKRVSRRPSNVSTRGGSKVGKQRSASRTKVRRSKM